MVNRKALAEEQSADVVDYLRRLASSLERLENTFYLSLIAQYGTDEDRRSS